MDKLTRPLPTNNETFVRDMFEYFKLPEGFTRMTQRDEKALSIPKEIVDAFELRKGTHMLELALMTRVRWLEDEAESLAAELEQVKRERDALQAELDALNEEYFSDVHTARDPMLDKIRQLERERDAYYDSMQGICATCKKARYCMLNPLPKCPNWQWRGVKEVNE